MNNFLLIKKRLPLIIFGLYFLLQFFVLLRVGFTWDEPSILMIGKRNLDFWTSGNLSINGPDYSAGIKTSDGPLRMVWGSKYYPPLLPTLAVFTHKIVTQTFHILPTLPGYHLFGFIVGFIGVVVLYLLLKELGFSQSISLGVSLLYGFYPSIIGQMRNDMKDVPLAAAVIIMVYFFLKLIKHWNSGNEQGTYRTRSFLYAVFLGLSFGAAFLIKPTAALLIVFMAVYLFVSLLTRKGRQMFPPVPILISQGIIVGLFAVIVIVLCWPAVWIDPIGKLTEALTFFRTTGYKVPVLYFGRIVVTGDNIPWHYPFGVLLVQTPLSVLFFMVLGIIGAFLKFLKTRNPLPLFFIIWVLLALFRFSLHSFYIYAKVRHLMDALPGLFILAAYGIDMLSKLFASYKKIPYVQWTTILIGVVLVHEIAIFVQFVPYEPSYFNIVVGGTKNVAEKELFDVEYWGSGVKEAMDYLRDTVKTPSNVYTCTMAHMAKYYNSPMVTTVSTAANATYFIIPNSHSYFQLIFNKLEGNAKIVCTVRRAGADLLYVYEYTGTQLPQCGVESED